MSMLVRKTENEIGRFFGRHKKSHPPTRPPPQPSPPLPPSLPPSSPRRPQKVLNTPFLFHQVQSTIVPDPSKFFIPSLLSTPLPTNSFFQNFVLNNAEPEYIHPYLIKPSISSLSLSYPSRSSTSTFISQIFTADLTISASEITDYHSQKTHVISSFSDLGVTLEFPSSNMQFFLVRGSPFLTVNVTDPTVISISTVHSILSLSSNNASLTKYTLELNNGQIWLIYASSPISLNQDPSKITSEEFSGIIRIALLPDSNPKLEVIISRFCFCYPISGDAKFTEPFSLEYKWEKRGWGDLIMLAHPLHLQLLSVNDCEITVLNDFKYRSIDGELVGVVGDSWVLKAKPVPITWHSIRGINQNSYDEIVSALSEDINALNNPSRTKTIPSSCYFSGKSIARAARLGLIAEEVSFPEAIPTVTQFLKETIEPWLDGTLDENGFLYDTKWKGVITKQGSKDADADFGFGLYNDHHYHLGYFLYGIAVLAKIDSAWGRKYRPQAYSLMADFMNLRRKSNSKYPRLRCFDLYKLHSWAGGLSEFADGRNQESTSEAGNAYYSAALMGLAYGDTNLVAIGATLTALEIHAAQTWWHVKKKKETEQKMLYEEEEFTKENRLVGVLWANKRDSGLWFAPPQWRECRLGIQVLPLLPITEVLFSDVEFVKELVEWTLPSLRNRKGVAEGWKGFVFAMEGVYDKESALKKIKSLKSFDDGNSFSNLLWWVHSRGDQTEEDEFGQEKYSWFDRYCY